MTIDVPPTYKEVAAAVNRCKSSGSISMSFRSDFDPGSEKVPDPPNNVACRHS